MVFLENIANMCLDMCIIYSYLTLSDIKEPIRRMFDVFIVVHDSFKLILNSAAKPPHLPKVIFMKS